MSHATQYIVHSRGVAVHQPRREQIGFFAHLSSFWLFLVSRAADFANRFLLVRTCGAAKAEQLVDDQG